MKQVDCNTFKSAIEFGTATNAHATFVEVKESYATYKCFLTDDHAAGVAIGPDGDIVSVFKSGTCTERGMIDILMGTAIQNGGSKLDCFAGFLDKLYARFGFKVKERLTFADEYAPDGWNYKRDGRPDVVMMTLE